MSPFAFFVVVKKGDRRTCFLTLSSPIFRYRGLMSAGVMNSPSGFQEEFALFFDGEKTGHDCLAIAAEGDSTFVYVLDARGVVYKFGTGK